MNKLINYYEEKSLRYKVIHKLKKQAFIILAITAILSFFIDKTLNDINYWLRTIIEIIFTILMILYALKKYIKELNLLIDSNRDKKEFKNLQKITIKNIDIESKIAWKTINDYEENTIKQYLIRNKLMKKEKINMIISNLKDKQSKNSFIEKLEIAFILPLSITMGITYLSNIQIEDAGVFIFYSLIYVVIIVLIISIFAIIVAIINEIIRYPIRDKETYKILERNLVEIYLKM